MYKINNFKRIQFENITKVPFLHFNLIGVSNLNHLNKLTFLSRIFN